MVRTDGDAEICVDEGVVYQVSHILEGLPIVFADPVREQQLEPQTITRRGAASRLGYFSPPVEVGLGEVHHKQGHLKRCQHQQHLGGGGKHIKTIYVLLVLVHLHFRSQTHPRGVAHPGQRQRTHGLHFENKLKERTET